MNYRKFQRKHREGIRKDTGIILKDLSEVPLKLKPGHKLEQAAVVKYRGYTALIPIEKMYNGEYRECFMMQTGIPLPAAPIEVPEPTSFSPNIESVYEVSL